jgi:DNA-binding transcriptional ArsR family regulator
VTSADPPTDVLAALADPTRWRVLALLAEEASSASALSRALPISRAAVLKHLGVLERTDLVRRIRVGREVRFSVHPERLTMTARWLSATAHAWDVRLAALRLLAETQPYPDDRRP